MKRSEIAAARVRVALDRRRGRQTPVDIQVLAKTPLANADGIPHREWVRYGEAYLAWQEARSHDQSPEDWEPPPDPPTTIRIEA